MTDCCSSSHLLAMSSTTITDNRALLQIVFNAFIFLQLFNQFNARKIKVSRSARLAAATPLGKQRLAI